MDDAFDLRFTSSGRLPDLNGAPVARHGGGRQATALPVARLRNRYGWDGTKFLGNKTICEAV